MTYRNIQGMRAIAALMVVSYHIFQNIAPMRTHWARPLFFVGSAGVDIFFVISGFIIYHAMRRSIASMETTGKGWAVLVFAMKRFIRIYPLYWIVFGTSCVIMAWAPPASTPHEPLFLLLALIGNLPNYRVYVAWTLTYEVYFYAVVALSMLLLTRRAMTGVAIWFGLVAGVALLGLWVPLGKPLDFLFAPIVLEFLLGIAVALLVDRGVRRFHLALLVGALLWMAIGTTFLRPGAFDLSVAHVGRLVAIDRSFALHVLCWGLPAAFLVYGIVVLEIRQQWIMPRVLQSLGDASYSIYLWHALAFYAVGEVATRLGGSDAVSSTVLTVLTVALGLGTGLLSYHFLEKPLQKHLVQRFLGRGTPHRSLATE